MTPRRPALFLFFGVFLVVLTGLGLAAQQAPRTPPATVALTDKIPVDPQITVGSLPNGLKYYIRANKQPEKRAELRLVVNAGSVLEDADQLGLAHFVEHMAFNGTKNFPKQAIVTFIESLGMKFGAHVNAYTSFDETVFMLQVPTDKPGVLDRAMLILEDWAQNVSFEAAEIDKERGVVIEEWRLGQGADSRMRDKQFPILLQGSKYAERLPIGKKEVLETFKPETLKRFYKDWYRPDLMAVIAVGDFEKPVVETMIKSHFGPMQSPTPPRPRPTVTVPDHPGTLYAIATDKEASGATVSVYSLMPLRDPTTVGAYKQQMLEGLFSSMLSSRMAEISQKPNAPFMAAGASRGLFVRSREASTLMAVVKDEETDKGLEALFAEAERVVKFGFTEGELDRQKKSQLRAYERLLAEKDTHESATLAAEFARSFLQREPIPGIAYEFELQKRFLPLVTLKDVNALAKEWAPDGNRVVVVSAPAKDGTTGPDQKKLTAAIAAASTKPLTAYVDALDSSPLVDPVPTPGTVSKTSTRPEFGLTEWELSNGVKVVLKPTTFKEDEVIFRAFSPGGTSLASDADFTAAKTAAQVIGFGGLGRYNITDLQKTLAGKAASVSASISETDEAVSGGGSTKDLETMFQLIYLTFTQPRADETVFAAMKEQTKAMIPAMKSQPEVVFNETLEAALTQNHVRSKPISVEMIDEMNLAKSMTFYKERFADASGFTFVFAGSFTVDAIKPLVERYLASLPSTRRPETWKDVGMRAPKGIVEKRVDRGMEPKSRATIVFSGPFTYDPISRITLRAMATALEGRLRDVLREELGGTYSVSVAGVPEKFPISEYRVIVDFGCAPDRTDDLVKAVFKEIEQLKANGPSDKQLTDIKEGMLRDYETNSRTNGFLASQISFKYEYGEDVAGVFGAPELYRSVTAAGVRDAARKYLDVNNYVKVTLFPEKK